MIKVADKLDSHVAQLVLELEKKSTLLNETLETLKKREEVLLHEREMFEEKVQWERNHLQVHYVKNINMKYNCTYYLKISCNIRI